MRATRGGIFSADMNDDRCRGTVGRKRCQDVREPIVLALVVGFSI